MRHRDVPSEVNDLATRTLASAIEVHRALGPGLREEDYRDCLLIDLHDAGIPVEREVPLRLAYKGHPLPRSARLDLLVGERLPIEIKAVDDLHPRHWLQTRSYVRFGGFRLGILVNFHEARLVDGWHRVLPGRSPSTAVTACSAPPASPHAEQSRGNPHRKPSEEGQTL